MKISRWLLVVLLAPLLALTTTLANAQGVWLAPPRLSTPANGLASATAPCPKNTRGLTRTCVHALGGAGSTAFNALTTVEAFTVADGPRL
ncbi:hypothetical protein [Streptomyces sp. NPDC127197]|uniref:hypothetical protein n=1 Tax=Streptomyces sp. NPDC127197 TaxID=3345388 RepID=UPI003641027F